MFKKKPLIVALIFTILSCGKDESSDVRVDDTAEVEEEVIEEIVEEAESFGDLQITSINFNISFPSDSNINIEELTVNSLVDGVNSMSSGSLDIFESDGFELVFVENTDGIILLYSLVKTSESNSVTIDSESTALALIMMHPWAMNFAPNTKQEMMNYVKGLDLFDTFVNDVEIGINIKDFSGLNVDLVVDGIMDNILTTSKDSIRLYESPLDMTVTDGNINLKSSGSVLSYGVRLTNEDGEVQNEIYRLNGEGDLISFDRIVDVFTDPSSAFSSPEVNIPIPSDGKWTVVAKNGKPFDDNSEENLLAKQDNFLRFFANVVGLFSNTIKNVIKNAECRTEIATFLLDKAPNLLKDFGSNNDANFLVKGLLNLFGGLVDDTISIISSCSQLPNSNTFFGKISKVFKLLNIFKKAETTIQLLTFATNWAFDKSPEEFCFEQAESEVFYCEGLEVTGDLDFGEVEVGSSSKRILEISNSLVEAVDITQIILPEGYQSNWISSEIPLFGSVEIEITFSPMNVSDYSGDIVIQSDALNKDLIYPIKGVGIENLNEEYQDVQFSSESIEFCTTIINENVSETLFASNPNNFEIKINISIEGDSAFTLDTNEVSIPAKSQATIGIGFSPTEQKGFEGNLIVNESNSRQSSTLLIDGSGFDLYNTEWFFGATTAETCDLSDTRFNDTSVRWYFEEGGSIRVVRGGGLREGEEGFEDLGGTWKYENCILTFQHEFSTSGENYCRDANNQSIEYRLTVSYKTSYTTIDSFNFRRGNYEYEENVEYEGSIESCQNFGVFDAQKCSGTTNI